MDHNTHPTIAYTLYQWLAVINVLLREFILPRFKLIIFSFQFDEHSSGR